MPVAKWYPPGVISDNLAPAGQIDSLPVNGASPFLLIDNTSNLDFYLKVGLSLTSINSANPGSMTLVNLPGIGDFVPDNTAAVGGGERYQQILNPGQSAKKSVFPMVRIYPGKNYLSLVNGAGTALLTGNTIFSQPYDEGAS